MKDKLSRILCTALCLTPLLASAQNSESGNIVVVFPDRAEKYLSTSMFDPYGD